ncbi:MAG: MarR family transcriptional regulator [Stigonema ocellatum SAG 48.90 = DSM 106950]|nr:MarR family transcriptional regulator [Stigonema ocellatum SAG 48.90 = DSM 106950]
MTQNKIQGKFYPTKHEEWLRACKELTPSEFQVLYYLRTVDPYSNGFQITAAQIARDLSAPSKKVHRQTISRALKELVSKGYLPESYLPKSTQADDKETRIRDRLQIELGGQVEVTTAVGRIDLLTSSEVIEIKNIDDSKEALGKILAYSAFFPEHGKRIHLFGRPDLTKLALAQTTCFEFGITVTFETEGVG